MKEEHSPHNETVDVVVPLHVSKLEVSVGRKTHTGQNKLIFTSLPLLDKYVSVQLGTCAGVWPYFIQGNRKYGHSRALSPSGDASFLICAITGNGFPEAIWPEEGFNWCLGVPHHAKQTVPQVDWRKRGAFH